MKIVNGAVTVIFNKSGIEIQKIDNNGHNSYTQAPLTPKDWSKLRKWAKKNKKSLTTEEKVKTKKSKAKKLKLSANKDPIDSVIKNEDKPQVQSIQ